MSIRPRGPGYGIRGPRHDALQAVIALAFAFVLAVAVGGAFQSLQAGVGVFLCVFVIIFGVG